MNGKRYFLDTNAIIQLLKGNKYLLDLLAESEFIAASIVSRLEFLSFLDLSNEDKALYEKFESRITIVELSLSNMGLLNTIVETRAKTTLKLPDAIISSSADFHHCVLVTADKKLLSQTQCKSMKFDLV